MAKGKGILLGLRNPEELGEQVLPLYRCAGSVHSVQDFAQANINLLSAHEQNLLFGMISCFSTIDDIPSYLRSCLCRSREFSSEAEPTLSCQRSGARSARLEKAGIKFKGCRPMRGKSYYPVETLPFHARAIQRAHIPFGTLTVEGVMREILAYCFLKKHDLPIHATPLCVYEYLFEKKHHGYCLVLSTRGEVRVEEFVNYPRLTVEEMIAQSEERSKGGPFPWGSELSLKRLNLWWYVEEKAKLLTGMHFHGGFRGILNSNIGNDVVVGLETAEQALYLCDYDTFRVVSIPENPGLPFLQAFVLQCLIEVVKGSLSVLDYVHLPKDSSALQRGQLFAGVYFEKSSLWKAYFRKFLANARRKQWNMRLVKQALTEAAMTEALAGVLGECVLNTNRLREVRDDCGVYYPHN